MNGFEPSFEVPTPCIQRKLQAKSTHACVWNEQTASQGRAPCWLELQLGRGRWQRYWEAFFLPAVNHEGC